MESGASGLRCHKEAFAPCLGRQEASMMAFAARIARRPIWPLGRLWKNRLRGNEGKAFITFHHSRFSAIQPGGRNQPPSDSKRKRHHGRFPASPNMAQTPPCSSAVPLHHFPPVSDLKDAISAWIPPRQRENFAAGRLLDAGGVLEAVNDAPRTSWRSRGAADGRQCGRLQCRRSCCMLGPRADRNRAPLRDLSR